LFAALRLELLMTNSLPFPPYGGEVHGEGCLRLYGDGLTVPLIAIEGCHGVGKSSIWPHLNEELQLNYSGLDRCFLSVWAFSILFKRPAVDLRHSAAAFFANSNAFLVFIYGEGCPDKPHPAAKAGVPYDNSDLRLLLEQGLKVLVDEGYSHRILMLISKAEPPSAFAKRIAQWVHDYELY
jgi:hypothetical protein